MTQEESRLSVLSLSVKSFVDLEQPRNAEGYNTARFICAPTTKDIIERARMFEKYIDGKEITFESKDEG